MTCKLTDLIEKYNIVGLNIEGGRPTYTLPYSCKWYNIIQVIDEPLKGNNFDDVMKIVHDNNYDLIEQAVGIDILNFIDELVQLINEISKFHKNILVHVHQYTGTTILNKILAEKTGQTVILDDTNFFESPVDYSKIYPNIDALISISQCAGLNQPAGTWIISKYFMNFDVQNNIIYTNKINVQNDMNFFMNYCGIDYVSGIILVANDLWNPNFDVCDSVLAINDSDNKVLQFVKDKTKIFDESHDWRHAVKVAFNSTQLADKQNYKFILYMALLHDVCDHKYPNAIPRNELKEWIYLNLPAYKLIDELIDHVSYSKQIKNPKTFDPFEQSILNAVRDGDRMEALGEIGIERCRQTTIIRNGILPDDIIIHCFDKLLKLVPDNYIITRNAKVIKDHNYIVDYVIKNLPLTSLKYDMPTYLEI